MYPKIHISYVSPFAFKRQYASDLSMMFFICFNNVEKSYVLLVDCNFWKTMHLVCLENQNNNKKDTILTNGRHDWLATKFFMNQKVLCINPKILVNECKWECYTWIKNAIMIRTLTKFVGFEAIWLKALIFVWLCVILEGNGSLKVKD